MGVFVPVSPFKPINIFNIFYITGTEQLFFLGGIAISVGVFTYSYKVIKTVGTSLVALTPLTAFIVVLSESLVLFLFSSETTQAWLIDRGLPSLPLVPISSSQAVIGAVLGIGLAKGGKNIRWNIMKNIVLGWVVTPLFAGIVCYISLFFLQNVFDQQVYKPIPYQITKNALQKIRESRIPSYLINSIKEKKFENAQEFYDTLKEIQGLYSKNIKRIMYLAELDSFYIYPLSSIPYFRKTLFSSAQIKALKDIEGKSFQHKWEFHEALEKKTQEWSFLSNTRENKSYNKYLEVQLNYLYNVFRIQQKI
jgi:PiT family inorganic phosphate transporter